MKSKTCSLAHTAVAFGHNIVSRAYLFCLMVSAGERGQILHHSQRLPPIPQPHQGPARPWKGCMECRTYLQIWAYAVQALMCLWASVARVPVNSTGLLSTRLVTITRDCVPALQQYPATCRIGYRQSLSTLSVMGFPTSGLDACCCVGPRRGVTDPAVLVVRGLAPHLVLATRMVKHLSA